MKTRKSALAASLILAAAAGLFAPAPAAASEFQFGLSFSPALPQGAFKDLMGRTVWGGTLSFAFRPSRGPILIGTSLGLGAYDTDRWEAWLGLTYPDVMVDVRATNSIFTWNVFLRLQPQSGLVRPYLDVFAGIHVLSTDTRVGDGGMDDDGDGDFSVNNATDTAFAYGVGAGIQFPVIRFVKHDGRRAGSLDLDLGVRYAKGGRADYLVETDWIGVYDTRTSRTDLLTVSAGLTFSF